MTKSLLVLPLLLAACTDATPTVDLSDSPSTPVAFDQLEVDGAPAAIAIGGVQVISIPNDPLSVGWSGRASTGFDVEPYGDIWPNTRAPVYRVRALADSAGTFAIQTDHGIASGAVTGAELDHVEAHPVASDSPRGAAVVGPRTIEIALYTAGGQRLIDGSLAIRDAADPTAVQRAWDRVEVSGPGTHELVLAADSMPEQQ